MFAVSLASVAQWGTVNNTVVPTAIDLVCPKCRRRVTFSIPNWDAQTCLGKPNPARCPACTEIVPVLRLGGKSQEQTRLYVDAENPTREPLEGIDRISDDVMPPSLKRAYRSALNVLASGEAEATAAACRRVLEGVMKRVLPDNVTTTNLARRIQALTAQHEQLTQPLVDLSDSLRESGNLGAHFSDEVETTIEDAGRMIELLDYLLTYLFVLPDQIHRFRTEVLAPDGLHANAKVSASEGRDAALATEPRP